VVSPNRDPGSDLDLYLSGAFRNVYVYGSRMDFARFLAKLTRPPAGAAHAAIRKVADYDRNSLFQSETFKPVTGSNPRIWEIRKDQMRLLCCFKDGDIVILNWVQKKRDRLDPTDVERALRLAKEICGDE